MLVSSKKNLRPCRNKVNYRKKRPYRKTFKFWIMKGKLDGMSRDAQNYCDCSTFNYFRTFKLAGHLWIGYQCRKCGKYTLWRSNPSRYPIFVKGEEDSCEYWLALNKKNSNYCFYSEEYHSLFENDIPSDYDNDSDSDSHGDA